MPNAKTPDLEERFTEPQGWRWHSFQHEGRRIRFGTASPKDSIPDGIIVCLPGLSEFGEKYFEVARQCLSKNYAFWVIDWACQGKSSRFLKNPHKRHSYGFEHDVTDLHYFIKNYIKNSSVHPDKGRIPLIMLGHSMGGNIGFRYLAQHPDMFQCAAFSAPMFGIKALHHVPSVFMRMTTCLASLSIGTFYVLGGGNWNANMRILTKTDDGGDAFSSDPKRNHVHNAWCEADPELQVGSPTFGWVHHANESCVEIFAHGAPESIITPCLIARAGRDVFVENTAINKIADRIPDARNILLKNSQHEIMMERNEIRSEFMNAFFALIKDTSDPSYKALKESP